MKFIFHTLLAATLLAVLPSCLSPEQKTKYTAELKTVGNDIVEAGAISAGEIALAAAKAKLAEIQAAPIPADAGLMYALERGVALTTAQGFVNLAEIKLNALKAKQAEQPPPTTNAKQPVPDVIPDNTLSCLRASRRTRPV